MGRDDLVYFTIQGTARKFAVAPHAVAGFEQTENGCCIYFIGQHVHVGETYNEVLSIFDENEREKVRNLYTAYTTDSRPIGDVIK